MDELGITDIFAADEVVGILLKAHGVALEAHSEVVLAALGSRLDSLEAKLDAVLEPLQKSLDAAGRAPTPRGSAPVARDRIFGNPSLNAPVVGDAEVNKQKGILLKAQMGGLIGETEAAAMMEAAGTEGWQETWADKYAAIEKQVGAKA